MELTNISITYARENGENRRNSISYKKPEPIKPEVWNPHRTALNHRKHEGLIYRQSEGGFERKGKPRYQPDFFE